MQIKKFSVGKDSLEMFYLKGKVVGKDKNLETRVLGGGGGGYSYKGTGNSFAAPVTSKTVVHDKIFIVDENAKEYAIELTDWDLDCREGHELLLISILKNSKDKEYYVAIKNFTTANVQVKNSILETLAGKSKVDLIKQEVMNFVNNFQ